MLSLFQRLVTYDPIQLVTSTHISLSMQTRIDPTRTTLLRKKFESEMIRRFRWLQKQIHELLVEQDAFGLTHNAIFEFSPDSDKVAQFDKWLLDMLVNGVIETTTPDANWTDAYVRMAWDKGIERAEAAITKTQANKTEDRFGQSFTPQVEYDTLKLLQTRAFTDLVGVTNAMADQIRRVLTDGLLRGDNPRNIARELNKKVAGIGIVRARMIARTEVIRAHAEGALYHMEKMGVEEIGVEVEWSTTGDGKVCPKCAALEGAIIPIAKAHGMFPRHPNCRCAPIPYVDDEPTKRTRRRRMKAAIKKSLSKDNRSTWAGQRLA